MEHVNDLRRANKVPFQVIGWLGVLTPVIEHDEFGMMYKGRVLAEDAYGRYIAIVGTTDQLLGTPADTTPNGTPYKILKVTKCNTPSC